MPARKTATAEADPSFGALRLPRAVSCCAVPGIPVLYPRPWMNKLAGNPKGITIICRHLSLQGPGIDQGDKFMFTGIVQGVAKIRSVTGSDELRTLTIDFPEGFADQLERGASVAVNGVCLTATDENAPDSWAFDVMQKSLDVTNLRHVTDGALVNVERAAHEGAEIGGHPLSGHVDFTAKVQNVTTNNGNKLIRFSIPANYAPYLFSQGYIAIDGASLTISDISKPEGWFEVWLIPETRRATIMDALAPGDEVNIEIDRATQVVVETIRTAVEEALAKRFPLLEAALEKMGISANALIDDQDTQKLIKGVAANTDLNS